jgi:EF hand
MNTLRIARRLLLGAAFFSPTLALAQPPGPLDGDGPPPSSGRRGGPGGDPGEDGLRPPGSPIIAALDTNHDGELSPEEIRNASAALKMLDHNRDGVLDHSELGPRRGGGPDGPPDGRPQGRGFGEPPPQGPDGPPDGLRGGGRRPGANRGRPAIGNVLPPFIREGLTLSDRQRKQIADLETHVKGKLESILTTTQVRQVRAQFERGPVVPGGPGGIEGSGGRGQGGPGDRGPGRPPGFGPGDNDDVGPPTRPRRPANL